MRGGLPGEQRESSFGAQRPADVGERGDQVAEEHRTGAADGDVERPWVEAVDLRIGVFEAGVLVMGEQPDSTSP